VLCFAAELSNGMGLSSLGTETDAKVFCKQALQALMCSSTLLVVMASFAES